jgi:histidine triad (HIT) family protein
MCLFCNIAKGDIPSHKIYENDKAVSFLDIHPISLGHTVVIPKNHASSIVDLPDEEVEDVFMAVKKATSMLEKALGAENFTIGINHGRMLGHPDIDHLHIHVIPRFEGDGGKDIHSVVNSPPKEDITEIKDKIVKANG